MMRDGDFLPDCLIPVFNPDFGSRGDSEEIPRCASKSDRRHTEMRSIAFQKINYPAPCAIWSCKTGLRA
jgi:hypothetical protein